jgi:hypothetical protein
MNPFTTCSVSVLNSTPLPESGGLLGLGHVICEPPRTRGRNGWAASSQFVEVELAAASSSCLVIEVESVGRILLSEPAPVALLVLLLASIAAHGEEDSP